MSVVLAALAQILRPLFESLVAELFRPRAEVSSVEAAEAHLESMIGVTDEDHDSDLLSRPLPRRMRE